MGVRQFGFVVSGKWDWGGLGLTARGGSKWGGLPVTLFELLSRPQPRPHKPSPAYVPCPTMKEHMGMRSWSGVVNTAWGAV